MKKTKLICFANQKGGTGKTALAVNVADWMRMSNKRVLLVDCDPQANSSHHLGVTNSDVSLKNILEGEQTVKSASVGFASNFYLVPSNSGLSHIQSEIERDRFIEVFQSVIGEYHYIIFDLPPGLSDLLLVPLSISHYVFLCVLSDRGLGTIGLKKFETTFGMVKKDNPDLSWGGIILNQTSGRRTLLGEELKIFLDKEYPGKVLKNTVRNTVKVAEAAIMGKTVKGHVKRHKVNDDFQAVTKEIMRRVK